MRAAHINPCCARFLCVSLSKNGVSHVPAVFQLSLDLFLLLIKDFKQFLKMQIEVFFKDILLSMLELASRRADACLVFQFTPCSSFQHKWMVMVALTKVCSDPQTVVDIYLNYDCDEYLNNIFERMVTLISKSAMRLLQLLLISRASRVAQGKAVSDSANVTPAQESSLRVKSIECLSLIMRCLVQWSKDMAAEEVDYTAADAPAAGEGKELTRAASHSSLNETGESVAVPTTEYQA